MGLTCRDDNSIDFIFLAVNIPQKSGTEFLIFFPTMISCAKSKHFTLAEDHLLVKASAGTNIYMISELFSSIREQANSYHLYPAEESLESVSTLIAHINAHLHQLTDEDVERINYELALTFRTHLLVALQIMAPLIDIAYMEHKTRRVRFANMFALAFEISDDEATVDAAIKGLRLLVKDGGVYASEIVGAEVTKCLEWLAVAGNDFYLYTGSRILAMLATEVPELLRPFITVELFLNDIWTALSHTYQGTREYSGEALDRIMATTILPHSTLSGSIRKCENYLTHDFPVRFWHGSLLMLTSIVKNTRNSDYSMTVMDLVLQKRLCADECCRLTLIRMIPYFPLMSDLFVACYITRTLREILYPYTEANDPTTRSCAFISLAELIANLRREAVIPHLNDMMRRIMDALCKVATEEDIMDENEVGEENTEISGSEGEHIPAKPRKETDAKIKKQPQTKSRSDIPFSISHPESTKFSGGPDLVASSRLYQGNVTVEALKCLGEIAKISDKAWLQPQIGVFMDRLFAGGLNRFLTDALSILGESLPEFVPTFQERLLTIIMHTLQKTGKSGIQVGSSPNRLFYRGKRQQRTRFYIRQRLSDTHISQKKNAAYTKNFAHDSDAACSSKDKYRTVATLDSEEENEINELPTTEDRILAVRTLATFNPKSNDMILSLLETHLSPLLKDPSVELRVVVVRTTLKMFCTLLDSPIEIASTHEGLSTTDIHILRKIVDYGVTDLADCVRFEVMKGLDSRLDQYLAFPDTLRTLFMVLYDEKLRVREAGLCVICRLTKVHPAYVIPALKKIQGQFIAELQHSRSSSCVEHSAKMLLQMIQNNIPIEPQTSSLRQNFLDLVLDKIQEGSGPPQLYTTFFYLLSELVQRIETEDERDVSMKVLRIVVAYIQDRTSTLRRRAALNTLSRIMCSASLVGDSFLEMFPNLFATLAQYLHGDAKVDKLTRLEVLRVLGTIGAVDPIRFKELIDCGKEKRLAENKNSAVERFIVCTVVPLRCNRHLAEHYPAVLLEALVKIFSSHSIVSSLAMRTMSALLTTLKSSQLLPHLDTLFPISLELLADSNQYSSHVDVLSHLTIILQIDEQTHNNMGSKHAMRVLKALREYCKTCDTNTATPITCLILANIVRLLTKIARSFSQVFYQGIETWIFNFLVQLLIEDCTDKREISMLVIRGFECFVPMLEKDIYYLVPLILQYINPAAHTTTGITLNLKCLSFLSVAAKHPNFKEISARTVHHLLRMVEHTPSSKVESKTIEILCEILRELGEVGKKFLPLIQMYTNAKGITDSRLSLLIDHFSDVATESKSHVTPSESCPEEKEVRFTESPGFSEDNAMLVVEMNPNRKITHSEVCDILAVDLNISKHAIELIDIQCDGSHIAPLVVHLRFSSSTATQVQNLFLQKYEEKSLPPILRVERVKKNCTVSPETNEGSILDFFSDSIPRERNNSEWMQWLDEICLEMLRQSSYLGMTCIAPLAQEYSPLAREIFPYVFYDVLCVLSKNGQLKIMRYLTDMLLLCEKDIGSILLQLADFLFPYRVTKPSKELFYGKNETHFVQRENLFDKFGIGYGEVSTSENTEAMYDERVIITRVGENSPGAVAKVPTGSILIEIDGIAVKHVSQIHPLLDGKLDIVLTIQPPPRMRYVHVMRPFFDFDVLIKAASERNQFARALYYCETLYLESSPDNHKSNYKISSTLLALYQHLHISEAATGLLEKLLRSMRRKQERNDVEHIIERLAADTDRGEAFETLQQYTQAIETYKHRLSESSLRKVFPDHSQILGLCRCYRIDGYWPELVKVAKEYWSISTTGQREDLALEATAAMWYMEEWSFLDTCSQFLPETQCDFYTSVLNIHEGKYDVAQNYIDASRSKLDNFIGGILNDSYTMAHEELISLQNLSELDEVISYAKNVERRPRLRTVWGNRFAAAAPVPKQLLVNLSIQSLVCPLEVLSSSWINFVDIACQQKRPRMAHYALMKLLSQTPLPDISPLKIPFEPSACDVSVSMAYFKYLKNIGELQTAFAKLDSFVKTFEKRMDINNQAKAWCHLTLGEWKQRLEDEDGTDEKSISGFVLSNLESSKKLDDQNFRAWHSWAMVNLHTALSTSVVNESLKSVFEGTQLKHLIIALQGFFRAVQLSTLQQNTLEEKKTTNSAQNSAFPFIVDFTLARDTDFQDLLRILFIWFNFGHHEAIFNEINTGLHQVELEIWLKVLPQLISRIDIIRFNVQQQLHGLLNRLGDAHPQALIYPLQLCANNAEEAARSKAACKLLDGIRNRNPSLVEDVTVLSEELIKVAISCWDRWVNAIETLAKQRSGDPHVDIEHYIKHLDPLYSQLDNPKTKDEKLFQKTLGPQLRRVRKLIHNTQESEISAEGQNLPTSQIPASEEESLSEAWTILRKIHQRIIERSQTLPKKVPLEDYSPLLSQRAFCLPVPGTYSSRGPTILFSGFHKDLQIIPSKQKPRQVTLLGMDGYEYKFLLKGNEDLRMDERVMQLFALLNSFFVVSPQLPTGLSISTYSVMPLSENVGLIQWIENTETVYQMIISQRANCGTSLMLEVNMLVQLGELQHINEFSELPCLKKREYLQHVLENTPSNDLRLLFWERNENSESWLRYRTNYIRTMAMMSMVGYVLGLGDRHLNNIMIHNSGNVMHIDFGDCFEVAMAREKFPEKVPFRLTRMLVDAMEACGFQGTFTSICEKVMTTLRKHKDSVTSLLETFAHDPLVTWKLDTLYEIAAQASREHKRGAKHMPVMEHSPIKLFNFSRLPVSMTQAPSPNTCDFTQDLTTSSIMPTDEMISRSYREKEFRHHAQQIFLSKDFDSPTINESKEKVNSWDDRVDATDMVRLHQYCIRHWSSLGTKFPISSISKKESRKSTARGSRSRNKPKGIQTLDKRSSPEDSNTSGAQPKHDSEDTIDALKTLSYPSKILFSPTLKEIDASKSKVENSEKTANLQRNSSNSQTKTLSYDVCSMHLFSETKNLEKDPNLDTCSPKKTTQSPTPTENVLSVRKEDMFYDTNSTHGVNDFTQTQNGENVSSLEKNAFPVNFKEEKKMSRPSLSSLINALHDSLHKSLTKFQPSFYRAVAIFKTACYLYPNDSLLLLKGADAEAASFMAFVRMTYGMSGKSKTAKRVLRRVRDKLHGTDFYPSTRESPFIKNLVLPESLRRGSPNSPSYATYDRISLQPMMTFYEKPGPIFLGSSYVENQISLDSSKIFDPSGRSTSTDTPDVEPKGRNDTEAWSPGDHNLSTSRRYEAEGIDNSEVSVQVKRLITEATSVDNLCVAYIGWCPFW